MEKQKKKSSVCIEGDALSALRKIPTSTFDACIADPPYNMSRKKGLPWAFSKHVTMQERWDQFTDEDYLSFCNEWLSEVCRVVKPNGNILVFGSFHNIYKLGFLIQSLNKKILNSIVWFKPNAQPNITCRMLTESTEQLVWFTNASPEKAKGWTYHYHEAKAYNSGKQLRNVWSIPVTAQKERLSKHPTQKPLQLIERLVLLFTHPSDHILDPFSGVGTTAMACLKHGRTFTMIEKNKKYFNLQRKRIEAQGYSCVDFRKDKPYSVKRSRASKLTAFPAQQVPFNL